MRALSFAGSILLLLALGASQTQSLVVTKFPHLETFDSWDECSYDGACYEMACTNLRGGWYTLNQDSLFSNGSRGLWIHEGPTSSNYPEGDSSGTVTCANIKTGPCTGMGGSGKYAYGEATACKNTIMELYSPMVRYSSPGPTVRFNYFMFGGDIRSSDWSLRLEYLLPNATSPVWARVVSLVDQKQTSATEAWLSSSTNLASLIGTPSAETPINVMFRFRVRTADKDPFWKSDIAIDNVMFNQTINDGVTEPWIDPSPEPTIYPSPSSLPVKPENEDEAQEGSSGLEGWQIGALVGGLLGGLLLLVILLALAVVAVLLVISPKRSGRGGPSGTPLSPMDGAENSVM